MRVEEIPTVHGNLLFITCVECGDEKDIEEFYNNSRGYLGKMDKCKECERERMRLYKLQFPEKVRESDKRMRIKNKLRNDEVSVIRKLKLKEKNRIKYADNRLEYNEKGKKWYAKNRDKKLASNRKWRLENPEKNKNMIIVWNEKNKDRVKLRAKNYRKLNKDKLAARSAKYKAGKIQATPSWANLENIWHFYKLAMEITQLVGESYWVDHIVPLRGKNVCGLHVHYNLQILSKKENISKGNRLPPELS